MPADSGCVGVQRNSIKADQGTRCMSPASSIDVVVEPCRQARSATFERTRGDVASYARLTTATAAEAESRTVSPQTTTAREYGSRGPRFARSGRASVHARRECTGTCSQDEPLRCRDLVDVGVDVDRGVPGRPLSRVWRIPPTCTLT